MNEMESQRLREADAAEAEEARKIYPGRLPAVHPTEAILESFQGRGWHDAYYTRSKEIEREIEAAKKRYELGELVEIPEPEW